MTRTREINNGMDIIDSRDVIARLRELESDRENAKVPEGHLDEHWTTADGTMVASEDWTEDQEQEYQALRSLDEDASGYAPDWKYGEALIRDSYFEEYARQTAEDIGAINRNATWPNDCIDWERAADELKQDYTRVDFDGVDYWVRS